MTKKDNKTFKQKLENFWYYHKIHTFIVAFFLFATIYLTIDVIKKQDPDYTVGYVGSVYVDQMQLQEYHDVFKDIVGDLNNDKKVLINYQTITVSKNILTNWNIDTEQQMHYSFIGGEIRLYIIEEQYIQSHEQYFEPLEGIIDDKHLEGGYKNSNGQTICVPISGLPMEKNMEIDGSALYIGIRGLSHIEKDDAFVQGQLEKSKDILKYFLDEKNSSI